MYIYIVIIFIFAWVSYPVISRKFSMHTANIFVVVLLYIVCTFAMGLRTTAVGVDTIEYKKIFDDYLNYSWHKILTDDASQDRIEFGFKLFMKVCGEICPSYYFYQFVFSVIYVYLCLNFIMKYCNCAIMTGAIFLGGGLYMQSFNIARQMFAVIIVGYAIVNLLDGKYIKSILVIFFASLFHGTSLIVLGLLLIYPLRKYKYILRLMQ